MRPTPLPVPDSLFEAVERGIALSLPFLVRRSLRRGLRGVWRRGDWDALPSSGVLMPANHHSWWDAYLVWLVSKELGRAMTGMMGEAQLERFPFFRHAGVIGHLEVRAALGRLARGDLLFLFPEGGLRPAGSVAGAQPGLAFLAEKSGAPLYPLAIRVAMRGAQHPEAFLSLGPALEPAPGRQATVQAFQFSVNQLLSEIDGVLSASDPEAPPAGFHLWMRGAGSEHERMAWAARLLGRGRPQA